jgi:acetyl-CoA carboxylase carboxyl transferase subunit alpha
MAAQARHYLDFERPIADLEAKIEELSALSKESGGLDGELASLRARVQKLRRDAYADLDPWKKQQVARHPERPHFSDYVAGLVEDFVELKGDRQFGDDQAIIGGIGKLRGRPVMVMGHEKGSDTASRLKHNFGMARPEGYRKAVRLMDLAEQFGLPVVTFVDTAGAFPGKEGEERGQGEAIARSTERGLTLGTPMVAVIVGEGGSGGALALAAANSVLMLEHSTYSVISPEGGSTILFRDHSQAPRMAKAMKITAQDLIGFGVIDAIVKEPVGGAHADRAATVQAVGDAVEAELKRFEGLDPAALRKQRAERFYAIGRKR